MSEYYYIYDPNTKTKGKRYTLNQLLYSWYEELRNKDSRHDWRTRTWTYSDPWNYWNMYFLFAKFGHTNNDFYYVDPPVAYKEVTEWVWVKKDPFDENSKEILVPRKKYVWNDKLKKIRNRIIDSYGRTIPLGYLKTLYMNYKPDPSHKMSYEYKHRMSRWGRRYYMLEQVNMKGYKFREGSVPGIHRYKRRYRRREADSIGTGFEKRAWYSAEYTQQECLEDYGISFKLRNKRGPCQLPYGIKHSRHSWRDYNWKSQSKKEKQWM